MKLGNKKYTRLETEELDLSFFSLTTSEETATTAADRRPGGEMALLTEISLLVRDAEPRKEDGLKILQQESDFSADLGELESRGLRMILAVAEQAISPQKDDKREQYNRAQWG